MKKFILSATLALACFAAQASNEIIKNDDDKNPKNKAKMVKVVPQGYCEVTIRQRMVCDGVSTMITTTGWSYLGCTVAFLMADFAQGC